MHPDPQSALTHSVDAGRPHSPLVLCVHGQGGRAGDWSERVCRIAAHGLHAVAIELPLHGPRSVDGLDPSGSLEMLDYLRLVDTAADELCQISATVGAGRAVGLLGHSLGAEIALVATSRTQTVGAVVAVGTVVSDPAWAGPSSPWTGGDTAEFAEILARVTLLDRPELLAPRNVTYLHGTDDTDAPLEELLRLLEVVGHQHRLAMFSGGHELTEGAVDQASRLLVRDLSDIERHVGEREPSS